ncbi:MAG: hypothetical protein LBU87_01195 [Lactobacillales bacterium]|jgi:phosphatidylglycerol lysyltransferase|nr:hypothetical protein [Lactobacillales bacterium]
MQPKTKRIIKKIISSLGWFFFIIAAVMLYLQLSKYPLSEIITALTGIPALNLLYACIAAAFGYMALATYDFLALKYIHKKLEAWKWMLVGFIGFSISNNAGHAIVSGATVRYRLYTRWRFKPNEILRMVLFSGFTYLVGCFGLIVTGYFMIPQEALLGGTISGTTIHMVTLASAIGLLIYFLLAAFYKKGIQIKGIPFKMPSVKMGIAQVLLGALDSLLASFVLYFALTPFVDIPFNMFIGVFIVAQVLGVFSQVPGGLGVFEGLFLLILPGDNNAAHLFGALIAYRVIYYLLPLIVAGITFVLYERRLKKKREKAWASLSS